MTSNQAQENQTYNSITWTTRQAVIEEKESDKKDVFGNTKTEFTQTGYTYETHTRKNPTDRFVKFVQEECDKHDDEKVCVEELQ